MKAYCIIRYLVEDCDILCDYYWYKTFEDALKAVREMEKEEVSNYGEPQYLHWNRYCNEHDNTRLQDSLFYGDECEVTFTIFEMEEKETN